MVLQDSGVRPLEIVTTEVVPATVEVLRESAFYHEATQYFAAYPPHSLMSHASRGVLYSLIRTMRPMCVAEIGTFKAGTTEVMARACWENGKGIVYTTDPYGGDRCPPIIASWPEDLRERVSFHPLTAMDFFACLDRERISLDLTLVDGNHDYEFALFDLQMTARRTRPSGIVVMDNAEQNGPFQAARTFLAANPAWRELGPAIASYRPSNPFDAARSSFPETSFIVLRSPPFIAIGEGPHSWGQAQVDAPTVASLMLDLARPAAGVLHHQVTLRSFRDSRDPIERRAIGSAPIDVADPTQVPLFFRDALRVPEGDTITVEIDLSWQGQEPLALVAPPHAQA